MVLSQQEREFLNTSLTFMKKLSVYEYNLLQNNLSLLNYGRGRILHHGGVDCSGLMAVHKGRLRVFILSGSGKEITLYRLLEGDACILSASCAFRNITFEVHIEAEEASVLYLLPTGVYQQLENSNPAVREFSSSLMASRFSEVMWVMEQVVFMSMDKRLALFLLEQSELERSDMISLTHDAIARNLGTAREVVTRLLRYLSSEGLVQLTRGNIALKDVKRLRKSAEEKQ